MGSPTQTGYGSHTQTGYGKQLAEKNQENEVAMLMGRLNDMDQICLRCAEKMSSHIGMVKYEKVLFM